MPQTWWGKTIQFVYIGGYFVFVIGAGLASWSHLTFREWQWYMLFQMFYAIIWPILLVKEIVW